MLPCSTAIHTTLAIISDCYYFTFTFTFSPVHCSGCKLNGHSHTHTHTTTCTYTLTPRLKQAKRDRDVQKEAKENQITTTHKHTPDTNAPLPAEKARKRDSELKLHERNELGDRRWQFKTLHPCAGGGRDRWELLCFFCVCISFHHLPLLCSHLHTFTRKQRTLHSSLHFSSSSRGV